MDQGDFGEGSLAGMLRVWCGEGDEDVEEVRFHLLGLCLLSRRSSLGPPPGSTMLREESGGWVGDVVDADVEEGAWAERWDAI